jgi:hypothetical protein
LKQGGNLGKANGQFWMQMVAFGRMGGRRASALVGDAMDAIPLFPISIPSGRHYSSESGKVGGNR